VCESVASVVDMLEFVASQIQMLFLADDVNVATVVHNFANKWHVLQTEKRDLPFEY